METAAATCLRRINRYLADFARGRISAASMLGRLCTFWRWASTFAEIRHANSEVGRMVPRVSQMWLQLAMMDQAADGRPVRIVEGKARKRGASTWIQLFGVFQGAHYGNQRAMTLGHNDRSTRDIFDIARTCASRCTVLDPQVTSELRWPDTLSVYYCQTAGATATGAGGTPSFLHQSEVAKWEKNKAETEYNSKIAVPDEPTTCVFQESTFVGRDLFWDRFTSASQGEGQYRAVFIPWWLDGDCEVPVRQTFELDEEERTIIDRGRAVGVDITSGMLQWRREKISELGLYVFRQEFPSTPEEAVESAGLLVLPNLSDCLIDALPFDPKLLPAGHALGGIDFGYVDATAIVSSIEWGGVLYVTRVFRKTKGLAAQWVDGLVEKHRYACDPSATQAIAELNAARGQRGIKCSLFAAPANDDAVSDWIALGDFHRKGRLRILRSAAPQLLAEANSLQWDASKADVRKPRDPEEADGDTGASFGHFDTLDALRYNVRQLLARERGATQRWAANDDDPLSRRQSLRAM